MEDIGLLDSFLVIICQRVGCLQNLLDDLRMLCSFSVVGDACTTATDCQFIANSECPSNVCACQAGHAANTGGNTCTSLGKWLYVHDRHIGLSKQLGPRSDCAYRSYNVVFHSVRNLLGAFLFCETQLFHFWTITVFEMSHFFNLCNICR